MDWTKQNFSSTHNPMHPLMCLNVQIHMSLCVDVWLYSNVVYANPFYSTLLYCIPLYYALCVLFASVLVQSTPSSLICSIMLCSVVLLHIMWYCAIRWKYLISCFTLVNYTVSCCIILSSCILDHIRLRLYCDTFLVMYVLFCFMSQHAALFNITVYCVMLLFAYTNGITHRLKIWT